MAHRLNSGKNGGSLFAADPEKAFDQQAIFWSPEALPTVLLLREDAASGNLTHFDLDWTMLAHGEYRHGPDGWHAIIPMGKANHRLYLPGMPARGSPISVELTLDANFGIRLQAANRFWSAIQGRSLAATPLALPLQRRRRFVLIMRALDAWLAGNSYRKIAEGLFGKERIVGRTWKDHDLRSLTIRLVQSGIALMRGGYRALLRPSSRKK
jgi:hypothetical protein